MSVAVARTLLADSNEPYVVVRRIADRGETLYYAYGRREIEVALAESHEEATLEHALRLHELRASPAVAPEAPVPALSGDPATPNSRFVLVESGEVVAVVDPFPPEVRPRARFRRISPRGVPAHAREPLNALPAAATVVARRAISVFRDVARGLRGVGAAGRGVPSRPAYRVGEPAPRHRVRRANVVNTGFADLRRPRSPIWPHAPLRPSRLYWFWFDIGEPVSSSAEDWAVPAPDLPAGSLLTVALFPSPGGFELERDADVGELWLAGDGSAHVARQPVADGKLARFTAGEDHVRLVHLRQRRLFFPVRTPPRHGVARFRCNMYHRGTLFQSRLVAALVSAVPFPRYRSLRSTADYVLSETVDPVWLSAVGEHGLSLLMNQNGPTHTITVLATGDRAAANVGEGEIKRYLEQVRGALNASAWGDEGPWLGTGQRYRYDPKPPLSVLENDLFLLAIRGYRMRERIFSVLTDPADSREAYPDAKLRALTREPMAIQVSTVGTVGQVLPVTLFYDYPLNTGAPRNVLCPVFRAALPDEERDLANEPCFLGDCPSVNLDPSGSTVCPGGFWGYRHRLGFPVDRRRQDQAPAHLMYGGRPVATVGLAKDLDLVTTHVDALRGILPGVDWAFADTRDTVVSALKERGAQLVYFYCHGDVDRRGVGYLRVGGPGELGITRDNLEFHKIKWSAEKRPLVFINGCKTAAIAPEIAYELVSGFVQRAHAAGVIGTEMTVFEPFATEFAVEFFRRFVQEQTPVGEAVRLARLALLKKGNPLGLAYTPYILAPLTLKPAPGGFAARPADVVRY